MAPIQRNAVSKGVLVHLSITEYIITHYWSRSSPPALLVFLRTDVLLPTAKCSISQPNFCLMGLNISNLCNMSTLQVFNNLSTLLGIVVCILVHSILKF